MTKIRTFCRLRPCKTSVDCYSAADDKLLVYQPTASSSSDVANPKPKYQFNFGKVFNTDIQQDAVFETVGRDLVMNCMDGFNGTLFAYGQTGSGKTYTIEGSAKRYEDRGILPRSLELLFQEIARREDTDIYEVHCSYMEIYNNTAYDLLSDASVSRHAHTHLHAQLPTVSLQEDSAGHIYVRNLTRHLAGSIEVAQTLLMRGNTSRTITATTMNVLSNRAHCIFTIEVTARDKSGVKDVFKTSKLHVVDLAGSERVMKSRVSGQLLSEAKNINLSLHYLEQVIKALHDNQLRSANRTRGHVPFRNSVLTMILKDSLGGNCLTSMVATINPIVEYWEESVSTAKFAMRVSQIRNVAMKNEILDDQAIIRSLRHQLNELQAQMALSGHVPVDPEHEPRKLSEEELHQCQMAIRGYVAGTNSEPFSNIVDTVMFKECLEMMRVMAATGRKQIAELKKSHADPNILSERERECTELRNTNRRLKIMIHARDSKIEKLERALLGRQAANEVVQSKESKSNKGTHPFQQRLKGDQGVRKRNQPLREQTQGIKLEGACKDEYLHDRFSDREVVENDRDNHSTSISNTRNSDEENYDVNCTPRVRPHSAGATFVPQLSQDRQRAQSLLRLQQQQQGKSLPPNHKGGKQSRNSDSSGPYGSLQQSKQSQRKGQRQYTHSTDHGVEKNSVDGPLVPYSSDAASVASVPPPMTGPHVVDPRSLSLEQRHTQRRDTQRVRLANAERELIIREKELLLALDKYQAELAIRRQIATSKASSIDKRRALREESVLRDGHKRTHYQLLQVQAMRQQYAMIALHEQDRLNGDQEECTQGFYAKLPVGNHRRTTAVRARHDEPHVLSGDDPLTTQKQRVVSNLEEREENTRRKLEMLKKGLLNPSLMTDSGVIDSGIAIDSNNNHKAPVSVRLEPKVVKTGNGAKRRGVSAMEAPIRSTVEGFHDRETSATRRRAPGASKTTPMPIGTAELSSQMSMKIKNHTLNVPDSTLISSFDTVSSSLAGSVSESPVDKEVEYMKRVQNEMNRIDRIRLTIRAATRIQRWYRHLMARRYIHRS